MSDPEIKRRIRVVMADGRVSAERDGCFRQVVNLTEFSNNAVQLALGSMIKDGEVRRRRPCMLDRGSGRHVEWSLTSLGRKRLYADLTTTTSEQVMMSGGVIEEADEARAVLTIWVLESGRRRFAPSWSELTYRSGLMSYGWTPDEVKELVQQLAYDGVIRLRQLVSGGLVIRPAY